MKHITFAVIVINTLMAFSYPCLAIPPGEEPKLKPRITQEEIVNGTFSFEEIMSHGQRIFSTPFNVYDGLGDGPMNYQDPISPGGRPSLQGKQHGGNGLFLRLNGLDAQSCLECHSVLSSETIPATFALGGSGGIASSAFFQPVQLDSSDQQGNGFAAYNGRFINPPFVFGAGGVELLAKEMTRKLQKITKKAKSKPMQWFDLTTHGVNFGKIRWVFADDLEASATVQNSEENTNCSPVTELSEIAATSNRFIKINRKLRKKIISSSDIDGALNNFLKLDTSQVEGIDADMVIRPFGRKGNNLTTRDFDCGAMLFHFGIQPAEIVGENVDADGDGVVNEILKGEMSALAIFNTTLEPPCQEPLNGQTRLGKKLFREIGCTNCHKPIIKTTRRKLTYSLPEVPSKPFANVYHKVDLSKNPVNFPTAPNAGLYINLFSDLKRHDMGDDLEESFWGVDDPADNRLFITARLWGVADTAPYMHDGRATTLIDAIRWHGGEAQETSDNFFTSLLDHEQEAVLAFLGTLRTPGSGACVEN